MARNLWMRRCREPYTGWSRWRRCCGGTSRSTSTSWIPSSTVMRRNRWGKNKRWRRRQLNRNENAYQGGGKSLSFLPPGGSTIGSGGDWQAEGGRGAVQRLPAGWVGAVQALSGGRVQSLLHLQLPQGLCHFSHQGMRTTGAVFSSSSSISTTLLPSRLLTEIIELKPLGIKSLPSLCAVFSCTRRLQTAKNNKGLLSFFLFFVSKVLCMFWCAELYGLFYANSTWPL